MLRALMFVAIIGSPKFSEAGQATCSNPGLPVGAAASPDLMPGRLTFNLTGLLLPITETETIQEGMFDVLYHSEIWIAETRLSAEYAITKNIAVGAALPYRMIDIDVEQYSAGTGTPIPNPSTTHVRPERLSGIGDASVNVHYAREVAGYRLHARLGTSIPLGSTVEDPHALGAIGQEHQHVQFGSGTFIPSIAIEAQHTFGPVTGAAFALAHLSLYENDEGFKQGHRISAGVSGSASFGLRSWTFGLGVEAHGETAEKWHGEIPMEEGNEGRLDLLLGPNVAFRPGRGIALVADVKYPVYSHAVGNQLDFGFVVGIGIVAAIETRSRPSWRGLDKETLPPSTQTLVPVAGRPTVFDLWADWCAPCRELDERLVAIARKHPELAVRKLEVGDSDSQPWQRFLAPGTFDLPHVKLYDASGTLVFERTAPPAELARAVEEFLTAQRK